MKLRFAMFFVFYSSIATILTLSLSGMVSKSSRTSHNEWQYSYSDEACETGDRNFRSKAALCRALRNDELNNLCAHSQRRQKFELMCGS